MCPVEKAHITAHALALLRSAQDMWIVAGLDAVKHSREIARDEYQQARSNFRTETSAAVRRYLRYQAICAIATLRILKTENPI